MRAGIHASILALLGCLPLAGQPESKDHPVGLILTVTSAKLRRADAVLPIGAKPGDLLYAGDGLRVDNGHATFLFCPHRSSQTLTEPGEVVVGVRDLDVRSGRLSDRREVAVCILPEVDRTPQAGPQHYGRSITSAMQVAGEPAAPQTLADLPEDRRRDLARELDPIDRALAADNQDRAAHVARAAILERYGLGSDALDEYRKLGEDWPEAIWVRSRVFVYEEEKGRSIAPSIMRPRGGKTYALLIGISRYQRVQPDRWLRYADRDAKVLADHLRSPRGGSLGSTDMVLLTDEQATTAAVKNSFETFLKARAGPEDTVVVFVAAHGVVAPAGQRTYILTYDSDPEDLASTALPMADVQNLVRNDLSRVGHLLVYVDVCHAGSIGAMRGGNPVNKVIEQLAEAEGDLFLFLASGPKEISIEGPQYGGGHGAFSYFLLRALNGGADLDRNSIVSVGEIIDYVREKVIEATNRRQHPRDLGSMEHRITLAELRHPGIELADWTPSSGSQRSLALIRSGSVSAASTADQDGSEPFEELDRAIAQGRILPDVPQSAFTILRSLRRELTPEEYLVQENKLRVALENEGQQILLRYLKGDQTQQRHDDFVRGAAYFEAARLLTPESLFLESRLAFCNGRARLFEKDYPRAIDELERAVRIDGGAAYAYNALGIAYLEKAEYETAVLAFRDASRRAPYWAYPLHNLALAYTQLGRYADAIRAYRQASALAPQYSYLRYNLGLLYQRLNRRKEAEESFRQAIALAPDSGDPYNALGYLHASFGRAAQAEALYRQAMEKNPGLLAARHNLAVLLAGKPARLEEALALWRENLAQDPRYLHSRLSLARALDRRDQVAEARAEFQEIVRQAPEYPAARMALANLLFRSGDPQAALDQLDAAVRLQPDSSAIHEALADMHSTLGHTAEATAGYRRGLDSAADPATRKRIERKLKTERP